jgi:hypothetical protein
MGFREHFADGSAVYEGYVCILESLDSSKANLPLTIVTTDKDKALKLKKDFGYEIYSIDLKGITYD